MLTLSVDQDSYEAIRSGKRKEEFRECKPYYTNKFVKEFPFTRLLRLPVSDAVRTVAFKVGVSPKSPKVLAECTLTVDGAQDTWGEEKEQEGWYYVLRIWEVGEE